MVATLKTGVIQEPSSGTANLTLDASGGVTVGQNLTVAGTTTFTGGSTFTGDATAAAFIPSGSTIPTNGLYRPAANTVGLATNSTNALYIDSSQNVGIGTSSPAYKLDVNSNANVNGTVVMTSPYTMRNKIINGAMVIDQRNAGASSSTINTYTIDRFAFAASQSGKFTWGQNLNSVTPPAGFSSYFGFQVSSAYSITSTDYFQWYQKIEGFNTADLAWGTASASSITLSFRVYSSLTGTFGGAIQNSAGDRSYPFSYTISAANTWTTISIVISGDTSGTWLTNNGIGIQVYFSLGMGSTYSAAAGSWYGAGYNSATGATSVVGTNGATFYITGVQLERGTVATPFEYRNYQQELAMCNRYYVADTAEIRGNTRSSNSVDRVGRWTFPTAMRAAPTVTFSTVGNTPNSTSAASISIYGVDLAGAMANSLDAVGFTNRIATAEL